jgi:hypothetical protein
VIDPVNAASTADLMDEAERLGRAIAVAQGLLMAVLGELHKREGFREEGATSVATWLVQRCGVAESTGRVWAHVAERLDELPHIARGLSEGAVGFDKVRSVVDRATPETDAALLELAREHSVRDLRDVARKARGANAKEAETHYASRYLRFNDERRTLTAQLPEDLYATVRGAIARRAHEQDFDGETPYDHRLCDALVAICNSASADSPAQGRRGGADFFVVVHTELSTLRDDAGSAEVEGAGLISAETVQRLSCDGPVALAVDDDVGHTMFEGRSKRFPTPAQRREVVRRDRTCRFPGCGNSSFVNVHHVLHWAKGGRTDLDNLLLLCVHHHHRVHEGAWSVTGNGNEVVTFMGPTLRPMTSRPSPLWTGRG